MSYKSTLEYIHGVQWRGQKPGLARTRALLEHLEHPERTLKFVHIGGTNGKGSTAAMIDSVLRAAGYRVGLYTSPFLNRFNERIRVNGEEISDADLEEAVDALRPFADHMVDLPSEFELITAAALWHFAQKQCDIVVLEVGLGGEFDATNVIPCPECAVLTPIGLDHTDVLGSTLAEIARTKAGIIKDGCDVVCVPQISAAEAEIRAACATNHAILHPVDFGALRIGPAALEGRKFDFGAKKNLYIPLLANYQPQNAATALTVFHVLTQKGWHITDQNIRNGLGTVQWPGRLELLQKNPVVLLDGSHNPPGAEATAESLRELFPERKFVFLLSVMADKDAEGIIAPLLPLAECFFTVTAENPRALTANALAEKLRGLGVAATPCPTVRDGLRVSLAHVEPDGLICALGTLYFSADVRRALEGLTL